MTCPPTPYQVLEGRTVWFWIDGLRSGKVAKVTALKKTGLRSLRVVLPSYDGGKFRHHGPVITVEPHHFRDSTGLAGVLWRGKIVPLEEFVIDRAKEKSCPMPKTTA